MILATVMAALAWAWAAWSGASLLPDPLADAWSTATRSTRIEDRDGRLLRELLSARKTRAQWMPLADLSPHLIAAALAAEDRRFFSHPGIDFMAVARAMGQNLAAGRVVSGASTITMQLVRVLSPGPRTWSRKIKEAALALRLERSHSKEEILEAYLNLVPCGNLVAGLPSASRQYLDKSPRNLSPAEAAFLMGLPQAPGALNPYRGLPGALKRRNLILNRMATLGFLTPDQTARACREPVNLNRRGQVFQAPHFVEDIRRRLPDPAPAVVRTTLDLELQAQVETLTAQAVAEAKNIGITQAAVLVMDHRTREVLAWVGSADFFEAREGQNDGVIALRQPGSALKPFTYAAAFDAGLTPATMIEDQPVEFGLSQGVYRPANYDGKYHGPVSLRVALASSLNIPAVKVLAQVGLSTVHKKMKAAGLTSLIQEPDFYGLGLTLGDGEVTLLELANAYATLASGGVFSPAVLVRNRAESRVEEQVFSPQAAYLTTSVLSDDVARATGFGRDSLLALPFPVAAKTGTSKNFRDNWCVGYTSAVVVAVWAGNFDARPMGRVSGISGAGPLWRQVMRLCASYYPPESFPPPDGLVELAVCPETGLRATPGCPNQRREIFMANHPPSGYCLKHQPAASMAREPGLHPEGLAILSPRPGERYIIDPGLDPEYQNLGLKAQVSPGLEWLVWEVNGREVGRIRADATHIPEVFWPLAAGRSTIRLLGLAHDTVAATDQVTIMVQ